MKNTNQITTINDAEKQLAKLFECTPFNECEAEMLLAAGVDINKPFYLKKKDFKRTFIGYALECMNLEALYFCINHEAELNYYDPDLLYEELLFDLQYNELDDEIDAFKLKATKILLENGADPMRIIPGEQPLFYYVYDKLTVLYRDESPESLAYLKRFFLLLVAFDKSGEWNPLDINRIEEYDIEYRPEEKRIVIVDWNKEFVEQL